MNMDENDALAKGFTIFVLLLGVGFVVYALNNREHFSDNPPQAEEIVHPCKSCADKIKYLEEENARLRKKSDAVLLLF